MIPKDRLEKEQLLMRQRWKTRKHIRKFGGGSITISLARQMSLEEYLSLQKEARRLFHSKYPIPQPCQVCGSEITYAHHTDYRKPFLVEWLCGRHHFEVHRDKIGWCWLGEDSFQAY
jgi:hypothetical protein